MPFEEEAEAEKAVEMLGALTAQGPGEGWKTIAYNFKFFQSPRLTSFDYKPRLVRQVTTFKPTSKIKLRFCRSSWLRSSGSCHSVQLELRPSLPIEFERALASRVHAQAAKKRLNVRIGSNRLSSFFAVLSKPREQTRPTGVRQGQDKASRSRPYSRVSLHHQPER